MGLTCAVEGCESTNYERWSVEHEGETFNFRVCESCQDILNHNLPFVEKHECFAGKDVVHIEVHCRTPEHYGALSRRK